jgi:hypothetical protein
MGIRQLVTEMNEELRAITGEPADGSDVGAVGPLQEGTLTILICAVQNCLGNCANQRLQLLSPIQ